MQYLSKGYSALVGDAAQPQSATETIDKLCDRIMNSSLLEDRRAAVLGLKGLSREYQLEVGTKGMPILLHVLAKDCMDAEITKAILDTLINLCMVEPPRGPNSTPVEEQLGIQFTEIYVKDVGNISLLLTLLDQQDFHVRYNCITFLKLLLGNKRKQLQDCILTSPMGVSRLMDLLEDSREVIRNEGLLLLIDMTHQNADIQKIIAFESAFERLLQIIDAEGALDGDVIVEDCLQLIQNLLKDNVSNQTYFRESGLFPRLTVIFTRRESANGAQISPSADVDASSTTTFYSHWRPEAQWASQKLRNATMAMSIVQILVGAGNPNAATNQQRIFQTSLFHPILQFGLARNVPSLIRAAAFYTIAYSIHGNQPLQELLGTFVVRPAASASPTVPTPVVFELISIALTATTFQKPDFLLRASCAFLIQSYLYMNKDTQYFLITTLNSPASGSNGAEDGGSDLHSAGSLLLQALLDWEDNRKDPFRSWFAAVILSNVVSSNRKCKEYALKLMVPDYYGGDEAIDFFATCAHSAMVSARESADIRVQIGFLCFMATCLYDFPEGVRLYLSEAANFSFLIEQISQSSSVDPVIQGLAAFLLGICFEYNNDDVPGLTRAEIQAIVISRIGADQFTARLNRLKESRQFSRYSLEGDFEVVDGRTSFPDVYFDSNFVDFFRDTYETVQKSIVNPQALHQKAQKKEEAAQHQSVIDSYKGLIAQQDSEMNGLKSKIASLQAELASSRSLAVSREIPAGMAATESQHSSSIEEIAQMKSIVDDLRREVEQLRGENAELKERHSSEFAYRTKEMDARIAELKRQHADEVASAVARESAKLQQDQASLSADLTKQAQQLRAEAAEWRLKHDEVKQEMDDLLVCLAEQDMEAKRMRGRLRELGEPVDDEEETEGLTDNEE